MAELRRDQDRVILTVDKGVAIVIMDREDYQDKAKALLEDQGTYKALKTDPTGRLKSKMINLLKKIKSEGGIDDILYKKLYPTGAVTPKFMAYLRYTRWNPIETYSIKQRIHQL